MNQPFARFAVSQPSASRGGSRLFGDWRSYYFGFYFAEQGAPGD